MRTNDLAEYMDFMKGLIIPQPHKGFAATIIEPFRHGLTNDELDTGMAAFRGFLYELFDKVVKSEQTLMVKKRANKVYEKGNFMYHPHFFIINSMAWNLYRLGQSATSRLETEPIKRLVIDDMTNAHEHFYLEATQEFRDVYRTFIELGFRFIGVDFLNDEVFHKPSPLIIEHENDAVVVGLKLISEALDNIRDVSIKPHNVIMRGDFYPLANSKPTVQVFHLRDFIFSQPTDIGKCLIEFENFLIENSCLAVGKKNNVGSDVKFVYSILKGRKKIEVCTIYIDMNECSITIHGNEKRVHIIEDITEFNILKKQVESGFLSSC